MIATAPSPAHTRARRAITAHFAGRTSPAAETKMRAHLLTCSSCHQHYQRHLMLARLDPRALPAADRLARGLGFRLGAAAAGTWRARLVAGLTVSMALAALAIFPVRKPDNQGADAHAVGADAHGAHGANRTIAPFAVRGTSSSAASAPAFWTYRVGSAGRPHLADRAIARDDELAFAYSNPLGKPFLMIFGVDEHRHVYWFHPAWMPGQPPPAAVRAEQGSGPIELPGAIHQALDGRRLRIHAVFSDRALDTSAVESAVGLAPTPDQLPVLSEGALAIGRTYEVQP